jgi:hypothetical protein
LLWMKNFAMNAISRKQSPEIGVVTSSEPEDVWLRMHG